MNRYVKNVAPLLRSFTWVCFLLILGTAGALAQTSIGEINGNPGKYRGQTVTIEGNVDRHVDSGADTDTKNYILKDETGSEIRAKTSQSPPETGSRYTVEGSIEISPFNRKPVLNEKSRSKLTSAQENQSSSGESLRKGFSTITVYLIFGLGFLVVIVLAYFAYASQSEPEPTVAAPAEDGTSDEPDEESSDLSTTELGGDGEESDSGFPEPSGERIKSESSSSESPEGDSDGPETLKFKAPPKTMKFVPGRLVIAAGPDQGKEFRIAGRPTPEGNVVTIGRAEVEGERAFAHIQLGDTYRTVSRMQAEIIQQDQTILLKNTSETNPTIVNGDNLPAGETVELQDGDMIRMGELMLRYERD
jgi:hypothetical protein